MILVRYPLPVLLRFGYQLVLLVSVLDFIIGVVLALTTTIFGICCWGREWLMYPNYNHLSWGWVAVLLSSFFHLLSSIMFFKESGLERRRKELNDHLLAQLEPPPILSQLEALSGMYIWRLHEPFVSCENKSDNIKNLISLWRSYCSYFWFSQPEDYSVLCPNF